MNFKSITMGNLTFNLPTAMANDLAKSSRKAMKAFSDKLESMKGIGDAETAMAEEMKGLHLILHGDAKPDATQAQIVRSFFGATEETMDKPECSKWSAAALAVVEYQAPANIGLAALVQWEKAARTARADIIDKMALRVGKTAAKSLSAKPLAEGLTRLRKEFDTQAPNKSTEATRAAVAAFPDSDTLRDRHRNNEKLAKQRKEGKKPSPAATPDSLSATIDGIDALWNGGKREGLAAGIVERLGYAGAAKLAAMLDKLATDAKS